MAQVDGIKVLRALLRYREDMLNGTSAWYRWLVLTVRLCDAFRRARIPVLKTW
jgi:hypothetical protein